MKEVENRYSVIKEKFPREFVLLRGTGCFWKKCTFCDYYHDASDNPFETNHKVIKQITGKFGVLDVTNSGSPMELDAKTVAALAECVRECGIKEIWFEGHWAYRYHLGDFAKKFEGAVVKFRTGVETFNPQLRSLWNKGIPEDVLPGDVAKYFSGVCLLVGTKHQTFENICEDIKIAEKYFEHYIVNVFVPNSTAVKQNSELIKKFVNEVYPALKKSPKSEVLLNNTDFGVG